MEISELENKLKAAEERVAKSKNTLEKYYAKQAKLEDQIAKIGYKINKDNYPAIESESRDDYHAGKITADELDIVWKYSWNIDAIKSTLNNIKEQEQIVANWKTKIELQKTKDDEFANIPEVVKEFIHAWRIKAFDVIMKNIEAYKEEYCIARDVYEANSDWNSSQEERRQAYSIFRNKEKELKQEYGALVVSLAFSRDKEVELNKILDREEKAKIFDLITRVTKVVGTIIDASGLSIGRQNGELNGIVVGTEGKCHVETIGAGGYNIQIYHYRVLVKPIRG